MECEICPSAMTRVMITPKIDKHGIYVHGSQVERGLLFRPQKKAADRLVQLLDDAHSAHSSLQAQFELALHSCAQVSPRSEPLSFLTIVEALALNKGELEPTAA